MSFLLVGMCFYSHVYYEHQMELKTKQYDEENEVELAELVEQKNDNTVCWNKDDQVQSS